MKVFGQLESASLENLSADPTVVVQGRFYLNTTTSNTMIDDGTAKRAILQNNGRAVIGTDTTAGNNIRFHHAGVSLLQFVVGSDTTAENTASTTLAQLGFRLSNLAATPATGNIGRIFYNTAIGSVLFEGASGFIQFATLTGTETLTNKTLTSPAMTAPSFDIATVTDQSAQPTTPASGKTLVYTKGGLVYKMGSDGLETQVGSAAAGVKNYVVNGTFESGKTTGWSVGRISSIVNGLPATGATVGTSATTGIAVSADNGTNFTGAPLAGVYSLVFNTPNSAAVGDCVYSPSMNVDSEDRAKVLTAKFSYFNNILTGVNFSGTSANSYAIAVADVTTPASPIWLGVAGSFNIATQNISGLATATFQTLKTTTAIQFFLYCPTTNAGSYIVLDSVSVGPQAVFVGPAVTDYQTYSITPTNNGGTAPTFGTQVSNIAKWRRVGDCAEITYLFNQSSAGTVGATGAYYYNLPPGLNADLTKITVSQAPSSTVIPYGGTNLGDGQLASNNAGNGNYYEPLHVTAVSSTQLVLSVHNGAGVSYPFGSALSPNYGTANLYLTFTAKIPIAGWSSNTAQSADTDTRVISFNGFTAASQALTGGSTDMPVVTVNDRAGAWNGSQFIVPTAGDYLVEYNATSSVNSVFYVALGGNAYQANKSLTSGTGGSGAGLMLLTGLLPGNVISVRAVTTTNVTNASIGIFRLSGPAVVSATESVNATYGLTASTAIAANAIIPYASKIKDTHSAFQNSVFNVPVSGQYRVSIVGSATANTNAYLKKTGTAAGYLTLLVANQASSASISLPCVAGDTLGIYFDTAATANPSSTNGFVNQVTFERTGN